MPILNRERQAEIEQALFAAIIGAPAGASTRSAPFLIAETVQACLSVVAVIAAMSPATATRRGTKRLTEDAARTLRLGIVEARENRASDSLDLLTVARMARHY